MPIVKLHRIPLLGVDVTPISREPLLESIADAIRRQRPLTIVGHNLHSVHLFHRDRDFRRRYGRADLRLIDGMPLLAMLDLARLMRGKAALGVSCRMGSTDWVPQAVALPSVARVVVLGASASSNGLAVERLSRIAPQADVRGIAGEPWGDREFERAAGELQHFSPDLVIVGMGMPLQEAVIERLQGRIATPMVMAAVGGAIDQLAGTQALAPRWIGRCGVEWLWRLARDPRRLGHRYLVEPWVLALTLLARRVR